MRNTPIRKAILELMEKHSRPLSAEELLIRIPANKTTIYRQLESLARSGLLNQVRFADRKLRYEPSNRDHHHHLVCDRCGVVKNIPLNETVLMSQLVNIKDFQVTRHSLEFFGVCKNCLSA